LPAFVVSEKGDGAVSIRKGWAVGAVLASMALLAGCSSGSSTSGTTSAAATSSSSAASSSAASSSAASSGTAGGTDTTLDAASVTWFETMCQGLAPLGDIQKEATSSTTAGEAASALAQAGTAMTETADQLSQLPPPNVDGGSALATSVVTGLKDFGTTFSDFSVRAAALKEGDTAALQQFGTDLQTALSATSPLGDAQPSAEVQAEVRKLPACQAIFGS
jgi:hypothetical protein